MLHCIVIALVTYIFSQFSGKTQADRLTLAKSPLSCSLLKGACSVHRGIYIYHRLQSTVNKPYFFQLHSPIIGGLARMDCSTHNTIQQISLFDFLLTLKKLSNIKVSHQASFPKINQIIAVIQLKLRNVVSKVLTVTE